MRFLLFITLILPLALAGQRKVSFSDNSSYEIVIYKKYKIFIADPNSNYNFSTNQAKTLKIDSAIHLEIERAIYTQYVSAISRYLDLEEQKNPYPHQSMDTTVLTQDALKQMRRKSILAAAKKTADKRLSKYDRYYYGYINKKGEEWVLILFNPHKIKYYTISGERHISNLSTLVYHVASKKLFLAGWSGQND